jgi:hypothetical protein
MDRATIYTITFAAAGILLMVVPIAAFRSSLPGSAVGVVSGVGAGFLVALVTFRLQTPSLECEDARSEYDGKADAHWVHLRVRNTSSGFLGGGTARDCRATLTFAEGNRTFQPKWQTRPNPDRWYPQMTPTGLAAIPFADAHLYDQAKSEELPPGGPWKTLDVAFKIKGDLNAYVSVPENFVGTGLARVPERAFGEGRHAFSVQLHNGGRVLLRKASLDYASPSRTRTSERWSIDGIEESISGASSRGLT